MSNEIIKPPSTALARPLLEADRAKAAANFEHLRAPATRRAYETDWRRFLAWCESRGVDPSCPAAEDVCAHLAALADGGLSASSIDRAYSAVAMALRAIRAPGWEDDGTPQLVRQQREAIRRKIGTAPTKAKDAMTLEELARVLHAIDDSDRLSEAADLRAIRDRAMVTVHFWGALRRAELCALRWEDVRFVDEGLLIHISRSKTDQEGKGAFIGLPETTDAHLCPVRSLREWHAASPEGLLFAVQAQSYVKALKKYCRAAGLDAKRFAGHSLRAGFVTAADAAGKAMSEIMAQTRHKSEGMVRRYIRHNDVWKRNAAKGLA